jgi:hypothetical protein
MIIDRESKRCRFIGAAFSASLALGASCSPVFAQSPTPPLRQVFYSNREPLTDTVARVEDDPRPETAEGALKVLDWLVFGNLNFGSAYDSNLYASPNAVSAWGLRLLPSVVAERNTGIQRTFLYADGDFRYYPSLGTTQLFNTTAGLVHVWEVYRDLIVRGQFETSVGDQYSNLVNSNGVLYTKPFQYTSLFGSTSVEKDFGRFFTAIGGSVIGSVFNNTTDNLGNEINETFQNGTRETVNGRIGYHISPIVYAFVEPSVNWGQYQDSNLNSSGYQVIGGLGSGRISYFNGEIYGGFLNENFSNPSIPTLTRPVYGGRVNWYPTRFVTLTGSLDQSIQTSDFSPTTLLPGSPTVVDTAKLVASWAMLRKVTLEASAGLQHIQYMGSTRLDDVWFLGAKAIYWLTDKVGITFNYQYGVLNSNVPGVDYNRNFVSLGAASKF